MIIYLSLLRIISFFLMYSGLILGSFCTLFILIEICKQPQLRTSLNFLLALIFTIDCLRAIFCVPFESYILIKTWVILSNDCNGNFISIKVYGLIFNLCRLIVSIRTCFSVIQPLAFIGIAYERLRTIVQRDGSLTLNHQQQQQRQNFRLEYTILWICLSSSLGIGFGIYQSIIYSVSNHTCYNHATFGSRFALIIRTVFILSAILISGMIYGRIYYVVKKYEKIRIKPAVSIVQVHIVKQRTRNNSIDIRKKNFRLAKQTFTLFVSFFLCRIPSIIIALVSLFIQRQTPLAKCILDEFINFSFQLSFIATISDPLVYIYSQPILKEKFRQNQICICKYLFQFE